MIELATYYQWNHFHPFEMRRSDPGWPDLTLVRPPELLFAELKADTGRLTDAQRLWIGWLLSCGQEVHVWRPRDFDAIHERLRPQGRALSASDGIVRAIRRGAPLDA